MGESLKKTMEEFKKDNELIHFKQTLDTIMNSLVSIAESLKNINQSLKNIVAK